MHFRAVPTRLWERVVDVLLVVFGFCMMTYTTALTIDSWMHGVRVHTPGYCDET